MSENIILTAPHHTRSASYKKKLEQKFIPWSWQWLKVHFNYQDYVINENVIPRNKQLIELSLKQMIKRFAKTRTSFRYPKVMSNTRDLGGYLTKDHRFQVKPHCLIRSGDLYNLKKRNLKALRQLNVTQIIDLRDLHEANQAPDDAKINVPTKLNSVYTRKGVNRNRNKTFKYGVIYRYHTLFADNQHAKKSYYDSITDILNNHNGATLYHCTEGRDRTGILSALILFALGVDKDTIFKDYLLTDYYSYVKPYFRQYAQIICFYNHIKRVYGGIFSYLRKIGITNDDIQKLRKMYLEPVK